MACTLGPWAAREVRLQVGSTGKRSDICQCVPRSSERQELKGSVDRAQKPHPSPVPCSHFPEAGLPGQRKQGVVQGSMTATVGGDQRRGGVSPSWTLILEVISFLPVAQPQTQQGKLCPPAYKACFPGSFHHLSSSDNDIKPVGTAQDQWPLLSIIPQFL